MVPTTVQPTTEAPPTAVIPTTEVPPTAVIPTTTTEVPPTTVVNVPTTYTVQPTTGVPPTTVVHVVPTTEVPPTAMESSTTMVPAATVEPLLNYTPTNTNYAQWPTYMLPPPPFTYGNSVYESFTNTNTNTNHSPNQPASVSNCLGLDDLDMDYDSTSCSDHASQRNARGCNSRDVTCTPDNVSKIR